MTANQPPRVSIVAPADGAVLSSPLAIMRVRFADTRARTATLHVGEVTHVVELPADGGELRENVTLLVGSNRLRAEIDGVEVAIEVEVKPSRNVTFSAPEADQAVTTRATGLTGRYADCSCPAGVISVNGFMQQFAVRAQSGIFDEKIVLRPGANHLAVQIGEYYATRLVTGAFAPAKLLVTLVWDTPSTDVDLYVHEPSGQTVYYSQKQHAGTLDVDRTQGFGPENYSLGRAGGVVAEGDYRIRVHYFADRGLGRTEWTVRVLSDESTPAQQRRTFYGILDHSSAVGNPDGRGRDWNDVCQVRIGAGGAVSIGGQ